MSGLRRESVSFVMKTTEICTTGDTYGIREDREMSISQENAPIYEALMDFEKKRIVPFDVPGHKREEEIRSW